VNGPAARIVMGSTGLLLIVTGLSIISSQPVPERLDYTGFLVNGQYFAPEVGALAPPFTLPMLDGGSAELLRQRGRPVILNFWATWCTPCEVEMPELAALQVAHPSTVVWPVNVGEQPVVVAAWLEARQILLPSLLDLNGETAALYLLRGQPTTVVIAPDGTILSIIFGATTRHQLETVLGPYL
jgi:thiol-disulfide isomerase/thioredoxin